MITFILTKCRQTEYFLLLLLKTELQLVIDLDFFHHGCHHLTIQTNNESIIGLVDQVWFEDLTLLDYEPDLRFVYSTVSIVSMDVSELFFGLCPVIVIFGLDFCQDLTGDLGDDSRTRFPADGEQGYESVTVS